MLVVIYTFANLEQSHSSRSSSSSSSTSHISSSNNNYSKNCQEVQFNGRASTLFVQSPGRIENNSSLSPLESCCQSVLKLPR